MATRARLAMDDVTGEYAELAALKVGELLHLCKKNRLSVKYRLKSELVKRLGRHFENSMSSCVPNKEFFDYCRLVLLLLLLLLCFDFVCVCVCFCFCFCIHFCFVFISFALAFAFAFAFAFCLILFSFRLLLLVLLAFLLVLVLLFVGRVGRKTSCC